MGFLPKWLSTLRTTSTCIDGQPSENVQQEEPIVVNFVGLLLVQGATTKRQVRYLMELICPESRQKTECSKRFSQFLSFRLALLDFLKKTCCCKLCCQVRTCVKTVPFPERHWPTRLCHINGRALPLEKFLQTVLDVSLNFSGCKKSFDGFHDLVSQFIGLPMAFNQKSHPKVLDFQSSLREVLAQTHISENASPILQDATPQTCSGSSQPKGTPLEKYVHESSDNENLPSEDIIQSNPKAL
ncbi:hypothetical protein THRCLA_22168 [Thraustotheca clavata]|uniref:PX domain-containing protein n=1 Tax=Thraustotheca clavata TaxID=74557 RepID=A0A1V9ZBD5_9STRA|nr:hypothetical protein THRCLA_22168 [Thraustotheca clavata]